MKSQERDMERREERVGGEGCGERRRVERGRRKIEREEIYRQMEKKGSDRERGWRDEESCRKGWRGG